MWAIGEEDKSPMENPDTPDPTYQHTYQLLPELVKLRETLFPLPTCYRLAFALCCCERLYPGYKALTAFLQTPDTLRTILDRLWKHALGQEMTEEEIQHGLATCLSISFGVVDCCEHYWDGVDAVGATYVALDACRQHNVDNVVRAAEIARKKVDRPLWKAMAQQLGGAVEPDEQTEIEEAIRTHPTMVAEIEKETEQLRFLYECEELTEVAVAELLSL